MLTSHKWPVATVLESTDTENFCHCREFLLDRLVRSTVLHHQIWNRSVTAHVLFWLPLKTSSNDRCPPLPLNKNIVGLFSVSQPQKTPEASSKWTASFSKSLSICLSSIRLSLCTASSTYYPRYTRRRMPECDPWEQSTDGIVSLVAETMGGTRYPASSVVESGLKEWCVPTSPHRTIKVKVWPGLSCGFLVGRPTARVRTQRAIACGAESVLLPQTRSFPPHTELPHTLENLKLISQLIHKLIETRLCLIVQRSYVISYILGRALIEITDFPAQLLLVIKPSWLFHYTEIPRQ